MQWVAPPVGGHVSGGAAAMGRSGSPGGGVHGATPQLSIFVLIGSVMHLHWTQPGPEPERVHTHTAVQSRPECLTESNNSLQVFQPMLGTY